MRRLLLSCTSQLSCVSNTGVQKRAGKWVLHSSVFRIRKLWWEWGGGMEGQGEPQDSSPIWCDGLKREAVNLKLHSWKRKAFHILISPLCPMAASATGFATQNLLERKTD